MKTLEQYTAAEINDEAARLTQVYGQDNGVKEYFAWIWGLRRECFERLAAAMDPDGKLNDWEGQMTAKHGPKVQVHGVTYGWKAALAVGLFGEDPNAAFGEGNMFPEAHARGGEPRSGPVWPAMFAEEHLVRAKRWLYDGDAPNGTTYITAEDR